MRTRDRDFVRAILHRHYLNSRHAILVSQIQFLAAHPNESFYIGFNYTNGRPDVDIYPCIHVPGPWGVHVDPCNEQEVSRAQSSGRKLVLHRTFISQGTLSYLRWFPLRSTSAAADERVRQMAAELEGIGVESLAAMRPQLLERVAALDLEMEGQIVEIH